MYKRLFAASVLSVAAIGSAQASLVLLGAQDFSGTGLGAVNTILTMQRPGGSTFESGSVGRSVGNLDDIITGDALTGASQTQTRDLNSLGITSAYDLRVVFNATEPGAAARRSIQLDDLQLNIFSPTGALLFSSGEFTSVNFADTFNGVGNSGFVFALDAEQAAQAQALAFGAGSGGNLVGLQATASNAHGGPETFYVAAAPIPEPGTWALFAAGLLGVAVMKRRRSS